jgi:hypothetical protein
LKAAESSWRRNCTAAAAKTMASGADGTAGLLGSVREREGRDRGDGKHLAPAGTASWPRPLASRSWHRRRAALGVRPTGGSRLDAVHSLWVVRSPPRTHGLPQRVQGPYAGARDV